MAKRKPVRVVVDTNVFISFLIGKRLRGLFDAMMHGDVRLVFSPQLLRELTDTASEPKFRKYFTPEVLDDLLFVIHESAVFVEPTPPYIQVCRDPKDDHVLALCKKAKADVLVTGDKDLLVLERHGSTAIMRPKEFEETLS
jgi:uncharacterized protein